MSRTKQYTRMCVNRCGAISYSMDGVCRYCRPPKPVRIRIKYQYSRPIGPRHLVYSYTAVHARLRYARGRPPTHDCVDCGHQAEQWAYNHNDPYAMRDWKLNARGKMIEVEYSVDINNYDPMCTSCHAKRDR